MNNAFTGYVKGRILSVIDLKGTGETLEFLSGYVDSFQDSFGVSYGEKQAFGNADPIRPYEGTPRSMSVTLQLIAENFNFARSNMENLSKLAQFCYPSYSVEAKDGDIGKSIKLKNLPKVAIKMMNLIINSTNRQHLPGYISNVNVDFDLKEGVFEVSKEEIYPKYIKVSFTFFPDHSIVTGHIEGSNQTGEADSVDGFNTFPYGIGGKKALSTDAAAKPENQAVTEQAQDAAALEKANKNASQKQLEAEEETDGWDQLE
jgi:hypothetical protein